MNIPCSNALGGVTLALSVLLLPELAFAQNGGVVVLDTIRVQDLGVGGRAHDVRLAGYDYIGSPVFSPDGHQIAFDAYKTVRDGSFTPAECWIVSRDGSGPKKLAVGATPRWSPAGDRLLFMREDQGDPNKDAGVFLVERDGTGERRLCAGRWPDWSSDGERIAFSRGGRPGGGRGTCPASTSLEPEALRSGRSQRAIARAGRGTADGSPFVKKTGHCSFPKSAYWNSTPVGR